jgi:hypothetical protein
MTVRHRTPLDHEIRERIMQVEDDRIRHGFMLEYLTLGRVSEVFGKYMPRRTDASTLTIDGEEAALFIVKTAKRKGMLRPVALPLDKKYEPWAEPVYEYVSNSRDEYPFALHENPETSKKYAMTAAKKMFRGLWWPMIDYTRSMTVPYTPDMVLSTRFGDKGYEEYLVELPDGSRKWTSDRESVKVNLKVESRWKPCTSHVNRKRRTLTLAMNYDFDGIALSLVGGWTSSSQEQGMPQAIKHYLFLDLSEMGATIEVLRSQAQRYFKKLLVPYSDMI